MSKAVKDLIMKKLHERMNRTNSVSKMTDTNDDAKDSIFEIEENINKNEKLNVKDGVATILIKGIIGEEITAESIRSQLEEANGMDVIFEIASPGGSVVEGIEIFNIIRNYAGKTTSKIIGLAASMGSYIALASNKVTAEDNAIYMIHNVSSIGMGNSDDFEHQSEILKSMDDLLVLAYISKTGKTKSEILKMMDDETWLFGKEMKIEGFVDKIISHNNDTKTDRAKSILDAKTKVKKMITDVKDKKKKSKDKNKEEGLKMENKISKFSDDNVELIRAIIEEMKAENSDIKLEDFKKYIQKIESVIAIEKSDVDPDAKPKEEPEEKPDDAKPDDKPADAPEDKPDEIENDKSKDKKSKDKPKEDLEDKPDDAKPDDKPPAEDSPEDKSEALKQSEIKAYQDVAKEAVSKMKEINTTLKMTIDEKQSLIKENSELKERLSKFESTLHEDLVKGVVDELSKFKGQLNEEQIKAKSDELSKMSDTALKIMKAEYSEFNLSKMGEEADPITKPSQDLSPDNTKELISKMQDSAVMKALKQRLNIRS